MINSLTNLYSVYQDCGLSLIGVVLKTTLILVIASLIACNPSRQVAPQPAQSQLIEAWQANQHVVWEIDWPAIPIGGPLTVEVWRAGKQYRFEILESTASALVGEMVVFDGAQAWRYNRFEPGAGSPQLSLVSDLFTIIDRLLHKKAVTAFRQPVSLLDGMAEKITLIYEDNQQFIFWLDEKTGLPLRINYGDALLKAREIEPLINPPAGLFDVGTKETE
jgi:hypothetical protein